MAKLKLPAITLFLLLSLLSLHVYGMSNALYVRVSFYDIIAHILGGMCIALSCFYVLRNTKYVVLLTVIAGIAWEIFEVYFNISGFTFGTLPYIVDTVKDVLNDTLGSIIIWMLLTKFKK